MSVCFFMAARTHTCKQFGYAAPYVICAGTTYSNLFAVTCDSSALVHVMDPTGADSDNENYNIAKMVEQTIHRLIAFDAEHNAHTQRYLN